MTRLDDARAALLACRRDDDPEAVRQAFQRDLGPPPTTYSAAKVRVLCSRGHLIANVIALATDTWPGVTLLPEPLPENDSPAWGLAYEIPRNWTDGDVDRLLHGRIRAACKRCKHRPSLSSAALAAQLAETAADQHVAARPHLVHRLRD